MLDIYFLLIFSCSKFYVPVGHIRHFQIKVLRGNNFFNEIFKIKIISLTFITLVVTSFVIQEVYPAIEGTLISKQ